MLVPRTEGEEHMPGRPITRQQAQLYMAHRDDLGQAVAAAKEGISERSGRRFDRRGGVLPARLARHWRTRPDPLEAVWASEVEPLLRREQGRVLARRDHLPITNFPYRSTASFLSAIWG